MTDYTPRLFTDDASIIHLGEGLLARTLPREDWTHEAHLAACLWIVRDRAEIDPESDMRDIISSYNVAVGGVNDETQGYHETITQVYIAGVRAHLRDVGSMPLRDAVNALLLSHRGRRELPLVHYSRERLFSVEARLGFVEPDLRPLTEI
ncbi:MAG: hypothetical protein WA793_16140 [Sphingorhabdus sp.]|uniref:hypothetical protein n=1 Tax=Sphingorhabdus sp. TaxID=1902408 RepID=UPI003CAF79AF